MLLLPAKPFGGIKILSLLAVFIFFVKFSPSNCGQKYALLRTAIFCTYARLMKTNTRRLNIIPMMTRLQVCWEREVTQKTMSGLERSTFLNLANQKRR